MGGGGGGNGKDCWETEVEKEDEKLCSVVDSMRHRLSRLSPVSSDWCIYTVPNRLRRNFRKAYTPIVVSIGPLHHGNEALKAMEVNKWRLFKQFLDKTNVSLEEYILVVKQREKRIRDCYADSIPICSDKFVNLILLDAVFIIEIMLKLHYQDYENESNPFFNKPWIIRQYILPDLRLLENQIPFFIIYEIYERAKSVPEAAIVCPQLIHISIHQLSLQFLQDHLLILMKPSSDERWDDNPILQMKHFVDGLRTMCIPPNFNQHPPSPSNLQKPFTLTAPTVTQLHQAGVRFKAGRGNMFSMSFRDGILTIPKLMVLNNQVETLLRNMIAFEQCHCNNNLMISNFVLLTRLIDTKKDLELLVKYNIMDRAIGDHDDVLLRIKTLAHEVAMDGIHINLHQLFNDLKAYCQVPHRKWLTNLKHIYFATPWTTISMVVATIILLLTLIQAIFSILSFTVHQ